MARLYTSGFETGTAAGEGLVFTGTPTFDTAAHNGALSLLIDAATEYAKAGFSGVLGRTYFARLYFRKSANPGATVFVAEWDTSGGVNCRLVLKTTGVLAIQNVLGTEVATGATVLANNTDYRVEMAINVPAGGNGTVELLIDGVTELASSAQNVGNTAMNGLRLGNNSANVPPSMRYDDVAINDDQSSVDNTYPGAYAALVSTPTFQPIPFMR